MRTERKRSGSTSARGLRDELNVRRRISPKPHAIGQRCQQHLACPRRLTRRGAQLEVLTADDKKRYAANAATCMMNSVATSAAGGRSSERGAIVRVSREMLELYEMAVEASK